MKYGVRFPDLGKSIAAKLSVNRMLKQQLGFGKGLVPNRKKAKYNKKYSTMVKKFDESKKAVINTQTEHVKNIQKMLKNHQVYQGMLSGILDAKTINSIKEFQKKHNLDVTGIVDFSTLTELKKDKKEKKEKN